MQTNKIVILVLSWLTLPACIAFEAPGAGYSRVAKNPVQRSESNGRCSGKRVWLFHVDVFAPFAFRDANGDIAGSDVDLVKAVCKEPGKNCDFVLGTQSDCMQSDDRTGNNIFAPGLQSGFFDGCLPWGDSKIRQSFYDFTTPYVRSEVGPGRLIVRSEDAVGFHPSGKTIILPRGSVVDASCFLQAYGLNVSDVNFLVTDYDDVGEGVRRLALLPERSTCYTGGAVVVKKGSSLPCWWNPAFETVKRNGYYERIYCENLVRALSGIHPGLTKEDACFL